QSSQQWHLFSLARGTFLTSSGNFFWQWELITGMQSSQQWHLFSLARGTFLTNSGNFFWQWELITGSENALSILFPTAPRTVIVHPSS
nr:hypothetical protein [Tanacetum cinerariifolium]